MSSPVSTVVEIFSVKVVIVVVLSRAVDVSCATLVKDDVCVVASVVAFGMVDSVDDTVVVAIVVLLASAVVGNVVPGVVAVVPASVVAVVGDVLLATVVDARVVVIVGVVLVLVAVVVVVDVVARQLTASTDSDRLRTTTSVRWLIKTIRFGTPTVEMLALAAVSDLFRAEPTEP